MTELGKWLYGGRGDRVVTRDREGKKKKNFMYASVQAHDFSACGVAETPQVSMCK